MENWKEAHDRAKEYIAALEEMKDMLRDRWIQEIKNRDEWKAAYQEAMSPRWLA